jgi:pimeloyl-ACP methyl ester carboxylesterase
MSAPAPEPFRQMPFAALPEQPRLPHPYFEVEHRDVVVTSTPFGAVRTHFVVHGSGPPLLLVHGLMTSSYSWRYVLEPFGRHFTVYAPDLPGAGKSDKPDVSYAPDALATFIGEFGRTVGIEGAPAVGNSLGGYLCMRLWLLDPGAFACLVNLHSPGVPLKRLHALRLAFAFPGASSLLDRMIRKNPKRWAHRNVHYYDESLKSLEEATVYGEPLATPEGRRAFARYLRDTLDPREMAQFVSALEARRSAGEPGLGPLRLLYARRDPMVPPVVGERLGRLLPDAELVWLERGSHFAHVDAPEVFLDAALPFLGRSSALRAATPD